MSNPQAISAATAILAQAVKDSLPAFGGNPEFVTVGPPHTSRDGRDDPQVNLFLYQVAPDAAWRNQDVPGRPGTSYPLLALRLSYLVTAFGQDESDEQAHDLLGAVMHRFHTQPIPPRTGATRLIGDSEIANQFEPLRITLQPLSLDELSKIWAGSPSPYRLSVGYEVSAVLIDSGKPAKSAPPVLGRAAESDSGFEAGTLGNEPALEGLRFPVGLPGLRPALGLPAGLAWKPDEITLSGRGLDHPDLRLLFRHLQLGFGVVAKPPPAESPTSLRFRLPGALTAFKDLPGKPLTEIETAANTFPSDAAQWPPGVYTVAAARAVSLRKADPPDRLYTTSPLAFGLLPVIDTSVLPLQLLFSAAPAAPSANMTATLLTPLGMDGDRLLQKVRLFAGSLELVGVLTTNGRVLTWRSEDPARLRQDFAAAKQRGETLYLRVQVDGVDNSLLKPPAEASPTRQFDDDLIVQDNS